MDGIEEEIRLSREQASRQEERYAELVARQDEQAKERDARFAALAARQAEQADRHAAEARRHAEQAERHAELYSELREFTREVTRETVARIDRVARELIAEIREIGRSVRYNTDQLDDLRNESWAQTEALLRVLDRLDRFEPGGPGASATA